MPLATDTALSTGAARLVESGWLIGIDVGGTFTDVVVRDDATGRVIVDKVPSTPDDQSRGVMQAVQRLGTEHGLDTGDLRLFVHGSTVATNAVLERKLPRTALIATDGLKSCINAAGNLRSISKESPDVREREN